MSTFISSAVGGKKAAPKAPARRRAAPPPKPIPTEPAPGEATTQERNSPPATENANEPSQHPPPPPPSPPATQKQHEPPPPPTPPAPLHHPQATEPPSPPTTQTQPQPSKEPTPPAPDVESTSNDVEEDAPALDGRQRQAPTAPMQERGSQSDQAASDISRPIERDFATQPAITDGTNVADNISEVAPAAPSTRKRKPAAVSRQPAKRQRRSSARSNATIQAAVNGEGPRVETDTLAGQPNATPEEERIEIDPALQALNPVEEPVTSKPRPKRKTKRTPKSAATVDPDDDGETREQQPVEPVQAARKTPRPRKPQPKKSQRPQGEGEVRSGEDGTEQPSHEGGALSEEQEEALMKKKQEEQEEALEAHQHDPQTLSMYDMSHDSRHGKVSEMERKMRDIDWGEVARKKREEADRIADGNAGQNQDQQASEETGADGAVQETTEGADGTAEDQAGQAETSQSPAPALEDAAATTQGVPQFRMVNGEIVVDEASLTVGQETAADNPNEVIEEENDLTQRLNRTTYINARRRDPRDRVPPWRKRQTGGWNEDDTDKFYEHLRMFGTDFDIISRMFPTKTRAQIKTKYNREERLDPSRINAALMKLSVPMSMAYYAEHVGVDESVYTQYDGYDHAQRVIAESMKDKESEMQALVDEEAENRRQAALAQSQKIEAKQKAKEARAARGPRRKKGAGTMGGGGEDG